MIYWRGRNERDRRKSNLSHSSLQKRRCMSHALRWGKGNSQATAVSFTNVEQPIAAETAVLYVVVYCKAAFLGPEVRAAIYGASNAGLHGLLFGTSIEIQLHTLEMMVFSCSSPAKGLRSNESQ